MELRKVQVNQRFTPQMGTGTLKGNVIYQCQGVPSLPSATAIPTILEDGTLVYEIVQEEFYHTPQQLIDPMVNVQNAPQVTQYAIGADGTLIPLIQPASVQVLDGNTYMFVLANEEEPEEKTVPSHILDHMYAKKLKEPKQDGAKQRKRIRKKTSATPKDTQNNSTVPAVTSDSSRINIIRKTVNHHGSLSLSASSVSRPKILQNPKRSVQNSSSNLPSVGMTNKVPTTEVILTRTPSSVSTPVYVSPAKDEAAKTYEIELNLEIAPGTAEGQNDLLPYEMGNAGEGEQLSMMFSSYNNNFTLINQGKTDEPAVIPISSSIITADPDPLREVYSVSTEVLKTFPVSLNSPSNQRWE